jgi:hypothetical protein
MSEINHFKVFLVCKMMSDDVREVLMWHVLIGCQCGLSICQ